MPNSALHTAFYRAAARTLLALTLSIGVNVPVADGQLADQAKQKDVLAEGQRPAEVVTWGDSIGNAIGRSVSQDFARVTNLGKDGSGLLIANHSNPLDHIPAGAVVLMSIGTNDVGPLMGSGNKAITRYADLVIAQAQRVQAQGATPIIIGMQAPTGPYTGNMKLWGKPGFVESWTETMQKVNAAIELAAKKNKIVYSKVEGRVPERDKDHLHYTKEGSHHIAENAFRDAGLKFR